MDRRGFDRIKLLEIFGFRLETLERVKEKQEQLDNKVVQQQEQLNRQQQIINEL